jgi:mannose-6-phosphate isomerase-like protein (cupin superfamily)
MKSMLALSAALLASVLLNAQGAAPARGQAAAPAAPPKPVTDVVFFDHAKVADAFAKGTTLLTAPDYIVLGSHRTANGQVEVHDKETDVIYVIQGSADFVTGGKMVGGKVVRPNQWNGTDITGGKLQHLVKGDMIIVPAGIPHWFKTVTPPEISYYVVKVVKP